jgi:hypothetical protein
MTFNDASFRTCDNGNQVSLAMMSYITTGKTWYEKNFGAYLESDYLSTFEAAEQKFLKSKMDTSWEALKTTIKKYPIGEEKMKTMFHL